MDFIDLEEASKYGVIYDGGAALNEKFEIGSGEVSVSKKLAAAETESVEEAHHAVIPILYFYMLKIPSFFTQGFKYFNRVK